MKQVLLTEIFCGSVPKIETDDESTSLDDEAVPVFFHQCKLTIQPGDATERHYHHLTTETYFVGSGEGEIEIGEKIHHIKAGAETESGFVDFVQVPKKYWHMISNTGTVPLVILSTKNLSTDYKDYYTV